MFGHKQGAPSPTPATTGPDGSNWRTKGRSFWMRSGNWIWFCQVKLLRVLQDQTFEPLGEKQAQAGGYPYHLCDKQESPGDGGARYIPRRPVLPDQPDHHTDAGFTRTSRRHSPCWLNILPANRRNRTICLKRKYRRKHSDI